MAARDQAHFSDHEINQQSLGNATAMPYLLVAYGIDCGWTAEQTALFCGRIFAKGWERMRGAGARAVVRQVALNLVCCGGTVRVLTGDDQRAEARVTELPNPLELDRFRVTSGDAVQFSSVFVPIVGYLGFRYAWRLDGGEIVLSVNAAAGHSDRATRNNLDADATTPDYLDTEISQQALSNGSSTAYLMVAIARACGRTPDDAAAFAAARFAPAWEPLRDEGAIAVTRQMAMTVVASGGEVVRSSGDEHRAETTLAGVPAEAEAQFFGVALDDVDHFYGSLCLTAEHLGYRSTWRREDKEIVLTVEHRTI